MWKPVISGRCFEKLLLSSPARDQHVTRPHERRCQRGRTDDGWQARDGDVLDVFVGEGGQLVAHLHHGRLGALAAIWKQKEEDGKEEGNKKIT